MDARAPNNETAIIAKILVSLPRYITLPEKSAGSLNACIDDNNRVLQEVLHQNQRQRVYRSVASYVGSNVHCDVAYISNPKKARKLLAAKQKQPMLLIASYPRFIDEGGAIGIVTAHGRVQIEINLSAAARLNAELAPDLIEISERVIQ